MVNCKRTFIALAMILMIGFASGAQAKGKLGFGTRATFESSSSGKVLKHVEVTSVTPDSPASAAGMKPGDYIVKVGSHTVKGEPLQEFISRLKNVKPGTHVHLTLKRGSNLIAAEIIVNP